jgi:hypothetical protein
MNWVFEPAGRVRRGGNAAAYAFRPDLNVFVREVVQNAKDQKRPDSKQAKVHFGLKQLRGKSLKQFLDALRWPELRAHLEAAAQQTQHAAFLKRATEQLDGKKELLLLRVDDSGTGGLVGQDLELDRPFASLCIDELFSAKDSAGAGGSYGLGKSVLWRFSGFSTVLFSSRLRSTDYQKGQKGLRLFGRTQLPWHSIGKEQFDGPCWFGDPGIHEQRPLAWSVWDPAATASAAKLHLDREPTPGTSILIVGFNPPAEETFHAEDLCRRFCQAAAREFWPVLCGDDPELQVTADLVDAETGDVTLTAKAEITEEVRPFVTCLKAFRDNTVVEGIENDNDVAAAEIPLKIPAQIAGDAAVDAKLTLCVKLAPNMKGLVNQVAYARGFGMVVKYRNLEGISLSAQPFVATLITGTLRGNTKEDRAAEAFLRMAEPPEHNTWGPNQRLQATYRRGYATQLEQLEKAVAAIIKRLVSQAAAEGDRGPQLLSRMFPIGNSGTDKRKHPFAVTKRTATLAPTGEWLFSGEVKRSDGDDAWETRIALRFSTEDGAEGSVVGSLDKLSPKVPYQVKNGIALLEVPAAVDKVAFTGRSNPKRHPVDARRAAVRLDVTAGVAAGDEDDEEAQ